MNRKVLASPKPEASVVALDFAQPVIRRSPIQGRSQDKVQRILAATATLADTMPLESITMMQIADAAGASFSSIYRFFPSKDAILEAVAIANLDRLQKLYEIYFAAAKLEDGAKIIDDAIDIYVAFARNEPGFRALWINGSPNAAIARRYRHVMDSALQLGKAYAIARLGFQDSPELRIRMAIAGTATTNILRYAFLQTEFPQEQVTDELKRWLKAAILMFR